MGKKGAGWASFGIVVASFVIAGASTWGGVWEHKTRKEVRKEVKSRIEQLDAGEIYWTKLSGMEIAGGIAGSLVEEHPDSLTGQILRYGEYKTRIGIATPKRCRVTYKMKTVDAKNFVAYCEEQGVTEYEGMCDSLDSYMDTYGNHKTTKVTVVYKKDHGTWVCDYYDYRFINGALGGLMDLYADYEQKTYENLQMIMEETYEE